MILLWEEDKKQIFKAKLEKSERICIRGHKYF